MTKYQLVLSAKYNHGNGYIEEEKEEYFSSYVVHLLHKFEQFKNQKDSDWEIYASFYKIENIRTMTLDEIGLHIHNDDDYQFITSFKDSGSLPF